MNITRKIIESIKGSQPIIEGGECALCGGSETVEQWYRVKDVISGSFTDFNEMKLKESKQICSFCKECLSNDLLDSPKGKRCGLRLYSWLVEEGKFITVDKKEKPYYLFERDYTPPFILAFSETGQKHISFKAKESYQEAAFWVCTEYGNIWFERNKWRAIYKIANHYYQKKVTKAELLACQIKPWKYEKYGLSFSGIIQLMRYRNTEQYKLIISVLQKEENHEN